MNKRNVRVTLRPTALYLAGYLLGGAVMSGCGLWSLSARLNARDTVAATGFLIAGILILWAAIRERVELLDGEVVRIVRGFTEDTLEIGAIARLRPHQGRGRAAAIELRTSVATASRYLDLTNGWPKVRQQYGVAAIPMVDAARLAKLLDVPCVPYGTDTTSPKDEA
jgi:hypothetical protein